MALKTVLEGYAYDWGDDGNCYGIHTGLCSEKNSEGGTWCNGFDTDIVDFFDRTLKSGKYYRITINIEELQGGKNENGTEV